MSEKKSAKIWSVKRKQEVVLRLLRGEILDALSRDTGQQCITNDMFRCRQQSWQIDQGRYASRFMFGKKRASLLHGET